MEVSYRRHFDQSYMMLRGDAEPEEVCELNMLSYNRIPGLLPVEAEVADGAVRFWYNITGKHTLSDYLERKQADAGLLRRLFEAVDEVLKEVSAYLLCEEHLLLKQEYLYLDFAHNTVDFVYLPGFQGDLRQSFQELMEQLLRRLDHSDRLASAMAYEMYQQSLGRETSFQEMLQRALSAGKGGRTQEAGILQRPEAVRGPEAAWRAEAAQRLEAVRGPEAAWRPEAARRSEATQVAEAVWRPEAARRPEATRRSEAMQEPETAAGGARKFLPFPQRGSFQEQEPQKGIRKGLGILQRRLRERAVRKEAERNGESAGRNYYGPTAGDQPGTLYGPSAGDQPGTSYGPTAGDQPGTSYAPASGEPPAVCQTEVLMARQAVQGILRHAGEEKGPELRIDLPVAFIGREGEGADLCIPGRSVSRMHARVERVEEDYYLEDLNSTNGTFLNGELLEYRQKVKLSPRDRITFGLEEYIFL